MGGPNNSNEVEVFLKNMFEDPYILTIKNGFLRKIIGKMIVKSRIKKSKEIYSKIDNKSPMSEITYKLTQKLSKRDPNRFYSYAMRYTPPFAMPVLKEMQTLGIERICLFSMYPQYSSTTTLSSFKDVYDSLKALNYNPEIKIIDRYFDNEKYLNIILESIKTILDVNYANNYSLLFSAHSLPKSIINSGDPYQREIEASFEGLKTLFNREKMAFSEINLGYQSKIGPTKWLKPDTKDFFKTAMGKNFIVCPLGFSIDNSETIYEIHQEYKDLALKNGALSFQVCPCMNDSDEFVELILDLTKD